MQQMRVAPGSPEPIGAVGDALLLVAGHVVLHFLLRSKIPDEVRRAEAEPLVFLLLRLRVSNWWELADAPRAIPVAPVRGSGDKPMLRIPPALGLPRSKRAKLGPAGGVGAGRFLGAAKIIPCAAGAPSTPAGRATSPAPSSAC